MSYGGASGNSRISTASDAALSNPASSQVLVYDGTTQKWTNSAVPGLSTKLDSTTASSLFASINSPAFIGSPTLNGAPINAGTTYSAFASATTALTNVTNSAVNIITLGRNTTIGLPNAALGSQFTLLLIQDGTGSRTVSWSSNVAFSGGTAPTITPAANRTDVLRFINVNGTNWIGYIDAQNLAAAAGSGGSTSTGSQFTVAATPGDGQVAVSWATTGTIAGLTGWNIGRDGNDKYGTGPWSTTDPSTATSRTFLSLTNGNQYTFSVAPVINGTTGTPVTIQSTPLSSAPAPAPTLTASVANGVEQATLSWTVNGGIFSGLTGWYVGRDGNDKNGTGPWSTTVDASATSQLFLTLTGGTTYNVYVAPVINGVTGAAVTVAAHPTAGSPPATGSSTNPSGVNMPVGNIPGWVQVFTDDFTGNSLRNDWSMYTGVSGATGTQWASDRVAVANSTARLLAAPSGNRWTAGAIANYGTSVQTYGKYDLRFRMDKAEGVKYAFLTWPSAENWPVGGEIDFAEDGGGNRIGTSATTHYADGNGNHQQVQRNMTNLDFSQWQTIGVEWTPGKLAYTANGTVWATVTSPSAAIPSHSMFLALQVEITGTNGTTPNPTVCEVDWVVAYRPA